MPRIDPSTRNAHRKVEGYGRRSTLRLGLLVAVLTLAAATPAHAATIYLPVPGGTIIVHDQPHQATIIESIRRDPTPLPISDFHCPTAVIVISAAKRTAMLEAAGSDPTAVAPYGIFMRSGYDAGNCRILLDAAPLRSLRPAAVCNLVLHEMRHAQGVNVHAPAGLMQDTLVTKAHAECAWTDSAQRPPRRGERRKLNRRSVVADGTRRAPGKHAVSRRRN